MDQLKEKVIEFKMVLDKMDESQERNKAIESTIEFFNSINTVSLNKFLLSNSGKKFINEISILLSGLTNDSLHLNREGAQLFEDIKRLIPSDSAKINPYYFP